MLSWRGLLLDDPFAPQVLHVSKLQLQVLNSLALLLHGLLQAPVAALQLMPTQSWRWCQCIVQALLMTWQNV